MVVHIRNQGVCDLLGRGDTRICDVVPPNRPGIIEVENATRKVGAVVEKEIEVALVRVRVQNRDQMVILCFRGLDLKAVDLAIVSGAHQFHP